MCTFAIALNYIDRSTLAIGNLKIREEFGISATGIGALQSAWSIAFALAQIPVGLMVDRVGSRRLLGWALVLWSVAQAAGGLVGGYHAASCGRAWRSAIFESPAFPASVRTVANWFSIREPRPADRLLHDRRRSRAHHRHAAADRAAAGVRLAGDVRRHGRDRRCCGAVVWFAALSRPRPEAHGRGRPRLSGSRMAAQPEPPVTLQSWRRLFGFRSMWGMILGAFCSGYAIWMYGTWLPGYLEMQHHVSIAKTGLLAMIPLACSIAGSLVGGWATDRLAHSRHGRGHAAASCRRPAATSPSAVFCAGAALSTETGARAGLHLGVDVLPVLRAVRQMDADHRDRAAILLRPRSRPSRISAPISAARCRRC